MKILYRILLNEAQDAEGRSIAWTDGYKPEHPLKQAYSGWLDRNTDEDRLLQVIFPNKFELAICEELFETFNIDHPADYRNRSMCVGDVVVLEFGINECVAYSCEKAGFKQIEVPAGHSSLTAVAQ